MQFWFKAAAAVAAALVGSAAPARTDQYAGIPAELASHDLRARLQVDGAGMTRSLTIREYTEDDRASLRAFALDLTRRMHLIVVSDDFGVFLHLHPELHDDGRFTVAVRFPKSAVYHLYADAEPKGYGHAVFRFDVNVGSAPVAGVQRARSMAARAVVRAGPYSVRLSTTRVRAGEDNQVIVAVTKSGEPADDLHPYLGVYAHIVALGANDLSYTHLHASAMAMSSGTYMQHEGAALPDDAIVPATMSVHVNLPKAGIYKVWVQFKGGSTVYAAPLVMQAI